ncbi:hypothetical protein M3Y96_01022600 [Aphelenchoides besseyi]|nr:hypothetical protein M3Y96_01022600 [Aphelenchoides besseyi]
MFGLRYSALWIVLLLLPFTYSASYDGEYDETTSKSMISGSVEQDNESKDQSHQEALKKESDNEYSNEQSMRLGGSLEKSVDSTTATSIQTTKTTPSTSVSYEVNLDSSETSTQYPSWVDKSGKSSSSSAESNTSVGLKPTIPTTPATIRKPAFVPSGSNRPASPSSTAFNVPRNSSVDARAKFTKRPEPSNQASTSVSSASNYNQSPKTSTYRPQPLSANKPRQPTSQYSRPNSFRQNVNAQQKTGQSYPHVQHQSFGQTAPSNKPQKYTRPQHSQFPYNQQAPRQNYQYAKMPQSRGPRIQQNNYRPMNYVTKRPQSQTASYQSAKMQNSRPYQTGTYQNHNAAYQPAPTFRRPSAQQSVYPRPSTSLTYHQRAQTPSSYQFKGTYQQTHPQPVAQNSYMQRPIQQPTHYANRQPIQQRRPNTQYQQQKPQVPQRQTVRVNTGAYSMPSRQNYRPQTQYRQPTSHSSQSYRPRPSVPQSNENIHHTYYRPVVSKRPMYSMKQQTTPVSRPSTSTAKPWTIKMSSATVASAEHLPLNPSGYVFGA